MTVAWMTLVGAAIGVVTSMFVAGRRQTGIASTTALGALTYLFGGLCGPLWGFPPLGQWAVAIGLSATLITLYLVYRTRKDLRRPQSSR